MPQTTCDSTKLRLSDLPIVLLNLPLMLILLSWVSAEVALLILLGLALVMLVAYIIEGAWDKARISLLGFGMHSVTFYLLHKLSEPYLSNDLWEQTLWLSSFVLCHVIAGIGMKPNKLPKLKRPTCCCDKRRNETLIAEYVRFDKLLLRFSIITIALYLPFSYILRPGVAVELVMTHLLALLALGLIIFELYHLAWIRRKLMGETWIPLLDKENKAIGRIPRSQADASPDTLPCVRLIAISQEMIYLERQASEVEGQIEYIYDSPFVDYLCEDDTPEGIAQRMIDARFCGIRRARPRHLLSYRTEAEGKSRLVYLMVVELEEPNQLYIDCRPVEGKWWYIEHLKPVIHGRDFSHHLESEVPILEQTILLAQRLRQNR